MRLAANLDWLFTERPFLDRPAAAREAEFDAVEALWTYDTPAARFAESLESAGLPCLLINTPKPEGGWGFAAIPGEETEFRAGFEKAVAYARTIGAHMVHVMSGAAEGDEAAEVWKRNMAWAAAEATDLTLTVEPLNPFDVPGYFLKEVYHAAALIEDVGVPNLRLQFDAYHAERIHGDALKVLAEVGDLVGHVQIAGAPHRGEPDTGTLDLTAFFKCLRKQGYDGAISGEYRPNGATAEGLGWMKMARAVFSDTPDT